VDTGHVFIGSFEVQFAGTEKGLDGGAHGAFVVVLARARDYDSAQSAMMAALNEDGFLVKYTEYISKRSDVEFDPEDEIRLRSLEKDLVSDGDIQFDDFYSFPLDASEL
jgi:hypothetical protein